MQLKATPHPSCGQVPPQPAALVAVPCDWCGATGQVVVGKSLLDPDRAVTGYCSDCNGSGYLVVATTELGGAAA